MQLNPSLLFMAIGLSSVLGTLAQAKSKHCYLHTSCVPRDGAYSQPGSSDTCGGALVLVQVADDESVERADEERVIAQILRSEGFEAACRDEFGPGYDAVGFFSG